MRLHRFLVGVGLALLFSANQAAHAAVTFSATGAAQTFVVPAGVSSVTIEALGAQGGANWVNNTNFGGSATGTLAVTPGQTLHVFVGMQPQGSGVLSGGFNGGGAGDSGGAGGGGASDVRVGGIALADRVIVAAGGGGAGFWSNLHVVGGVGGGVDGGDGYREPNFATNAGGRGATQSAGGTDGTCSSFNVVAMAGSLGQGGTPAGSNCGCEGYGGGGGYYGGAGSGNCRGGGGGSGYIGGVTAASMQSGVRQGDGEVRITFTGAIQVLTFPAQTTGSHPFVAGATFAIDPLATSALPNSGNPIVYSSTTTGVCTVSGTTVTIVAAGTCTIAADQAGDASYAVASRVTQSVTISTASQALTFPSQTPSNQAFASGAMFPISPLASSAAPNSGNPIVYSSTTTGVCTVSGTTVTIVAAGTCTIAADQAGDANYTAAPQVTQSVAISPASQVLTFPAPTIGNRPFVAGATFLIDPLASSASPNSGNLVGYTSLTTGVCTVSGVTVTMVSSGTCQIAADQTGDSNFASAARAVQTYVFVAAQVSVVAVPMNSPLMLAMLALVLAVCVAARRRTSRYA